VLILGEHFEFLAAFGDALNADTRAIRFPPGRLVGIELKYDRFGRLLVRLR